MSNDSTSKTIKVALALCIVCSVVVSTAAVVLKPMQDRNVAMDRKRNILAAAGMYEEGVDIDQQFEQITARLVDMRTGQFSDSFETDGYNQVRSAREPDMSEALSSDIDIANLGRMEHYAVVYLVGDESNPEIVILPVRGPGLWGPMLGFLALRDDLNTVAGLGFYDHKETPGLGGEIDNPRWKGLWPGKRAFRDGEVALRVVKGTANRDGATIDYEVDGLSGATLTGRGVDNLVRFWLGENGFGPFLSQLKAGDA